MNMENRLSPPSIANMILSEKNPERSSGLLSILALMAFLIALPIGSLQAAPRDKSCNEGSIGSCVDDTLTEQGLIIEDAAGLLEEVDIIVNTVAAMGRLSYSQNQYGVKAARVGVPEDLNNRLETLRNEHGRAKEANDATTDEEYDEMLGQADKEKHRNCKDSDITFYESLWEDNYVPPGYVSVTNNPGGKNTFGNGKCDLFEAEDLAGNIVWVNERAENMCEQICKGKPNQQGKSKERFLNGMQDSMSAARLSRQTLSLHRGRIAELGVVLSDLRSSGVDFQSIRAAEACGDGTPTGPSAELIAVEVFNSAIVLLDVSVVIGNVVTEVLETISDVAEKPCDQDVAGFNAAAACVPFKTAFHISKGITGVLDGTKSTLASTRDLTQSSIAIANAFNSDDATLCRKEIKDNTDTLKSEVALLKTKAGETSAALVRVEGELERLKSFMVQNQGLLLTPQGKRDDFPLGQ